MEANAPRAITVGSMSPRSIRRAAERKAEKLARKQPQPIENAASFAAPPTESSSGRSTGPRTPQGKAVSCLNHWKHGLTGIFRVHASESQELFDELRDALRAEHAPTTPTEVLLVDRLAEHTWLSQRAGRMADVAINNGSEAGLALMLRYGTTHDRAFHRCLAELRAMRCERRQVDGHKGESRQFESQNAASAIVAAPPAPETTPLSASSAACPSQSEPGPSSIARQHAGFESQNASAVQHGTMNAS